MGTDDLSTHRLKGLARSLEILAKWKHFVILSTVGTTVASIVVSLLLPSWYLASSTIMPPKNQSVLSALGLGAGLSRQLNPLRAFSSVGSSQDLYGYVAILKSRALQEQIVHDFDLQKVYDVRRGSMDDAIEELKNNIDFKINEEGTLRVEVLDKDPARAVAMADSFVTHLDGINRQLSNRESHSTRVFIERRVQTVVGDLAAAEENLKRFQEKNGFIVPPEQVNSSVSAIAELYSKKTLKEIEIAVLKNTMSPNNPELTFAQLQLSELEKKLSGFPEIGMLYFRLYRDYAVQQKIFETLMPLLEQARIEEQKDTPTLLLLDRATLPELPAKPKKTIIVIVFAVMALILSILVILMIESVAQLRAERPDDFERFASLWRENPFRGWWRRRP